MFRLVVLAAVAALVGGETTQVSQCTMNSGEIPINSYIAGCDVPPCGLTQLTTAVIKIIFRAPRNTHSMTTLATAYLPGPITGTPIPIPYPLGADAVTCNFLDNSYCPVFEGEVLQYTLNMYIQSSFTAGLSPTIEFRVQDDSRTNILCIRVPVTILPAETAHLASNGTLVGAN